MHYLYGLKTGTPRRLAATFSSEQQLMAYVRWATLVDLRERRGKFEQGSVLTRHTVWETSSKPLSDEDASAVAHNEPTANTAVPNRRFSRAPRCKFRPLHVRCARVLG